jgi:hypothetical protein
MNPNTKTLFHFFSKSNSNGLALSGASSPKTEPDSSRINDEPRRKSEVRVFITSVKVEVAPPQNDEISKAVEAKSNNFPQPGDCSTMKEEQDDIDPFEGLDFRDEDFRDDELDFPYEDLDHIEDDFDDIKAAVNEELVDPAVDNGPSCPFCNFSFKGLPENVSSIFWTKLILVNYVTCKPMSR